jgi:hypothetical protein
MKSKIIFALLFAATAFMFSSFTTTTKDIVSLPDSLTIQNKGNVAISKPFDLVKDHYYIISGIAYLKPNLSSYIWPKCLGNEFDKEYGCHITVESPYDNNKVLYTQDVTSFSCKATSFGDFKSGCLRNKDQFPIYFAFRATADVKDAQMFFDNTTSKITFKDCNAKSDACEFPVMIMKDTKVTLQDRKDNK